MNKLVFDIGGTNTKFALMSEEGKILEREKVRTDYSSPDNFYSGIAGIALKYKDRADAVAISTNGRMDMTNEVYRAYTIGTVAGTNLKEEVEKRVGLPVSIINDGFAAALGEFKCGAGKGSKNMLGIVLGSGMGGGIILDGKVYAGSKNNSAMVFGMINGVDGGKVDLAGVSTSFSMLLYKLAAIKQEAPENMTGERFFELYETGDEMARMLLTGYCRSIAYTVYNSAMLLDLDCIVVTGGLAARDAIIDGINESLQTMLGGFDADPATKMLLSMANVDMNDFNISVTKGELLLDANLYGALYNLLDK